MQCSECNLAIDDDTEPHYPHDRGCPMRDQDRVYETTCLCDNTVHPDCCRDCKIEEMTRLITGNYSDQMRGRQQ